MIIWEIRGTKFGNFWEGREGSHRFHIVERGGVYTVKHRLFGDTRFDRLGEVKSLEDAKYFASEWIRRAG